MRLVVAHPVRVHAQALAHGLAQAGVAEDVVDAADPDELAADCLDVLVVGEGFGPAGGLAAAAVVTDRWPDCRVVLLADSRSDRLLATATEAGVHGFALADAPLADLVQAVTDVMAGRAYVPPVMLGGLLRHLIDRRRTHAEVLKRAMALTNREREVLELLAAGLDAPAITRRLVLSADTVRTHIGTILKKLDLPTREEAAAVAADLGLVADLDEDRP